MKILCDECENEAVVRLTLTDMDGVVAHGADLCREHAEHIIEFSTTEKDKPLSILDV